MSEEVHLMCSAKSWAYSFGDEPRHCDGFRTYRFLPENKGRVRDALSEIVKKYNGRKTWGQVEDELPEFLV
jgi:hypothetical protein